MFCAFCFLVRRGRQITSLSSECIELHNQQTVYIYVLNVCFFLFPLILKPRYLNNCFIFGNPVINQSRPAYLHYQSAREIISLSSWGVILRGHFIYIFNALPSGLCRGVPAALSGLFTAAAHFLSLQHTLHKLIFLSAQNRLAGRQWGSRKTPQLKGPFPFQAHFPRRAGRSSRHGHR